MTDHTAEAAAQASGSGKYLSFTLADEDYMVEILRVQEIVGLLPITPVPGTPEHVSGVVNLRGQVIPILDLRIRFSLSGESATPEACIVIVKTHGTEVGVLVDRVCEVLDVSDSEIAPTPDLGGHVPTEYLLGIARNDGGVRLLLDVDRAVNASDGDSPVEAGSALLAPVGGT